MVNPCAFPFLNLPLVYISPDSYTENTEFYQALTSTSPRDDFMIAEANPFIPESASNMPDIIENKVDFPTPEFPYIVTISFFSIFKEIFLSIDRTS